MPGYRPIFKHIWKDPDFQELSPDDKLIFFYICTNDSITESGIYPLTPRTVANETGLSFDKVKAVFENGLYKNIEYDKEHRIIYVKNIRKYNTGGKPDLIRSSITKDLRNCPNTPLWENFFKDYPEYKGLGNGCQTVLQRFSNDIVIDNDIVNNKTNGIKLRCGEFQNVLLTEVEKQKLIERHGEKVCLEYIEKLSIYLKSKGKRYKDHYATILNWVRRDNGTHQQGNTGSQKQSTTGKDYAGGKYAKLIKS